MVGAIEATNLTVADFSAWMVRAFARQDVLIDAQPEHYLMDIAGSRGPHVVETLWIDADGTDLFLFNPVPW